jgi:hypothetical protein
MGANGTRATRRSPPSRDAPASRRPPLWVAAGLPPAFPPRTRRAADGRWGDAQPATHVLVTFCPPGYSTGHPQPHRLPNRGQAGASTSAPLAQCGRKAGFRGRGRFLGARIHARTRTRHTHTHTHKGAKRWQFGFEGGAVRRLLNVPPQPCHSNRSWGGGLSGRGHGPFHMCTKHIMVWLSLEKSKPPQKRRPGYGFGPAFGCQTGRGALGCAHEVVDSSLDANRYLHSRSCVARHSAAIAQLAAGGRALPVPS